MPDHERVVDDGGARQTLLDQQPQLRWKDDAGTHSCLLAGRMVAGSADAAQIVVRGADVWRLHAALEVEDDGVWIRDLGGPVGTFVDDLRVLAALVPDGATIRLGEVELRLYYNQNEVEVDLWPTEQFGPLVARSPIMRALFARLHRIAQLESTVLIQGETGTGKELVARALHQASPRSEGPFIVVDCGSLAESLLEAELFGHAKGAFTGAAGARHGAIEAANGGSVFLDEIGEMPIGMQPKLLRAIEGRTVRRVGETAYRAVDVRFIAATHRDLEAMVNEGNFREDLYFRLAVLPVTIPPLRARREDIPVIAERLLPPGTAKFSAEMLREFNRRSWPGNVRELRNFVERIVGLGAEEALALGAGTSTALGASTSTPPPKVPQAPAGTPEGLPPISVEEPFKSIRDRWLDHLEREYMKAMIGKHGRDTSVIAQCAGLDRSYVYRLMRKHEL